MERDSALMFTCSLIEYIGRERKLKRAEVVRALGDETIRRIYRHADVLHSEPIEHVASEYIELASIPSGSFDNVGTCLYETPDYWTIGEACERLIEDVSEGDHVGGIAKVYLSWMDDAISDYNSDLFFQPRDYLRESFLAGKAVD